MSFFARVLNHLVNQYLVEALANSRTFQRFAVRSNQLFEEAGKKTLEQQHKMQDLAKAEFTKWWRANPNATEEEARKAAGRISSSTKK